MFLNERYSKENAKKLRELYESAFPKSEKKPFSTIKALTRRGDMKIFSIESDDGAFIGLAIMILYSDIALLDYLAIEESKRGQGFGGCALEILKKMYDGKRLLLEIEDTASDSPDTKSRLERKKFYTSHGMSVMPYKVNLFGVDMEILTFGGEVDFTEYHNVFVNVFSPLAAKKVQLID